MAFVAGAGGLVISTRLLVPTGGAVVLAASVIFFVTLAIGALRRTLTRVQLSIRRYSAYATDLPTYQSTA